jgi:hypothetical protein
MQGFFRCSLVLFVLAACGSGVFLSCVQQNVPAVNSASNDMYPASVHRVALNSAGYGVLRLEGLDSGNSVYLSRVNASRVEYNTNVVSVEAPADPERLAEGIRTPTGVITMPDGEKRVMYERHWQVMPSDVDTPLANRSMVSPSVTATVGNTKTFYVDVSSATVTAKLGKIGKYCKIWVDTKLGAYTFNINTLADKFDEIYPIETSLVGYEYGGGPGGDGGVDGDPLIQILVYDIDGDGSGGTTMGYFYPGDEYQRGRTYPYSNETEIFYLDSRFLSNDTDKIYSTLIHEFNHMINFNVKVIQGGQIRVWNNETWYTEMLSMLAEDVVWPLLGGSSSESLVIGMRIPSWRSNYDKCSVMYWPPANTDAGPYYAANYAFGAYLVRNFGGVPLFSAIAKSHAGGRASIDGSLRATNMEPNIDVTYALERFGETLVYFEDVPENVYSFNKTLSETLKADNGNDYTYSFSAFDIRNVRSVNTSSDTPKVFDFKDMGQTPMPFNTVQIFQDDSWKEEKITGGRLDIQFLNVDTSAKYFVLVK